MKVLIESDLSGILFSKTTEDVLTIITHNLSIEIDLRKVRLIFSFYENGFLETEDFNDMSSCIDIENFTKKILKHSDDNKVFLTTEPYDASISSVS